MLALSNIPGVESTSSMSGDIFNDIYKVSDVSWSGQSSDQKYIFQSPVVGYKFIETLGMKMKEGRGFSRDFADNESRIILNETAVKLMGLENPVGKSIKMNGSSQIIGVVKDFNYGTLHNTIEPLIFRFSSAGRNILVKFKPDTEVQTKLAIKSLYSRFLPGYTFNLNYLDEEYKTLYTAETQVSELSKYFAGLGIFISCMGLFGLAAFTAQRRQKEISIRKILGASAPSLIALLADDFIRVILIAMIIAVPVSWFLMEAWLQSFAYRINISWWIFALAGLSAIMAACIAIASQFIRTIRMSPINALKSE